MEIPERATPQYFNAIAVGANERIMGIIKHIAPTFLKDRQVAGYPPIGMPELQARDPAFVAKLLARMLTYPQSDAEGAKLTAGYMKWADAQGFGPQWSEALVQAMLAERMQMVMMGGPPNG